MSAVSAYLEKRAMAQKPMGPRQQQDLELLQQWKQDPTPTKLEPLLQSLGGSFNRAKSRLRGAQRIYDSTLDASLVEALVPALQKYDPNSGASLNTWVTTNLQRGLRFVRKHQNLARIPEDQAARVRPLQQAQEDLMESLGRQGTPEEVAAHLNQQGVRAGTGARAKAFTPALVQKWQQNDRADVMDSSFEGQVGETGLQRHQDLIPLIRARLERDQSPQGQLRLQAYDRTYGVGEFEGKPAKRMGDVARALKIPQPKLSKLFTPIKKWFEDFE